MLNEYIHPFTWLRTDWPWCFSPGNVRLLSFPPSVTENLEKIEGEQLSHAGRPRPHVNVWVNFFPMPFSSITEQPRPIPSHFPTFRRFHVCGFLTHSFCHLIEFSPCSITLLIITELK